MPAHLGTVASTRADSDSVSDATDITNPMPPRPQPKPGRGGCNDKGAAEFVNSLVCSACIAWDDLNHQRQANELVFPPRRIDACDAKQIFRGLVSNFEDFAFGAKFSDFFVEAGKAYSHIHLSAVGDAASANCKGILQFFGHLHDLARRHNVVLTSVFSPCLIHQLARILLLHLEQRAVSAALYSITRLHQQAATRKATSEALRRLLLERFDYRENTFPPDSPITSASFRNNLARLLTGVWDPNACDEARHSLVIKTLQFFNGNLADEGKWSHYCAGRECHRNRQHAMNEATKLQPGFATQVM